MKYEVLTKTLTDRKHIKRKLVFWRKINMPVKQSSHKMRIKFNKAHNGERIRNLIKLLPASKQQLQKKNWGILIKLISIMSQYLHR